MKIRNGFVSNSSSSSFILAGVKLQSFSEFKKFVNPQTPEEEEELQERYENHEFDHDTKYHGMIMEFDAEDDAFYVGVHLPSGFGGGWGGENYDLSEFQEAMAQPEIHKLKAMGYNPQIWIGQYE